MKKRRMCTRIISIILILFLGMPQGSFVQYAAAQEDTAAAPAFKQEDLDQMLAPLALYPDSLVSQILMASTYPLEIVQADRWSKDNEALEGDALATALEAQPWDPSIKSLINFPQVLDMMNKNLEQTQKLGDAFLAQQKDVMATIQNLRQKAQAEGNLKTTKEQTVVVEKETQTIIIEAADPKVVYVPVYNPTVVYGVWWWPRLTPYYYYPPGYAAVGAAYSFAAGVAVGAAWGYAWGNCNWRGGDVNININQNANFNRNIDRSKQATQYKNGQGSWKHDASHRQGVSYRDQGTAQKYNRASTNEAKKSRDAFRGHADQGRKDIANGGADRFKGQRPSAGTRDVKSGASQRPSAGTRDVKSSASQRPSAGTRDVKNSASQRPSAGTSNMKKSSSSQRPSASTSNRKRSSSSRSSAFSGMNKGSSARQSSSRGKASSSSMSRSRSGGASRSGGGASRSGGGRSGGGGGRR